MFLKVFPVGKNNESNTVDVTEEINRTVIWKNRKELKGGKKSSLPPSMWTSWYFMEQREISEEMPREFSMPDFTDEATESQRRKVAWLKWSSKLTRKLEHKPRFLNFPLGHLSMIGGFCSAHSQSLSIGQD